MATKISGRHSVKHVLDLQCVLFVCPTYMILYIQTYVCILCRSCHVLMGRVCQNHGSISTFNTISRNLSPNSMTTQTSRSDSVYAGAVIAGTGSLSKLSEFVISLQLLYRTLDLSKDTLTHFDLVTINPDNIKSHYFFLSRILELLPLLTHLTISKVTDIYYLYLVSDAHTYSGVLLLSQGEVGLGEKGFKELVKGMTKSSGALQVTFCLCVDI